MEIDLIFPFKKPSGDVYREKETNHETFIFYFIYFQGEYKTSLTMDTLKKPGNFISKILSRNSSKNSLNHQDCEIQKFNIDANQVGFRHF